MGLLLYRTPPDPSPEKKPAAEQRTAQARSSIRRSPPNHAPANVREHRRRRILAQISGASAGHEEPRRRPPPDETAGADAGADDTNGTGLAGDREALRAMASRIDSRIDSLDDRITARIRDGWAHIYGYSFSNASSGGEDNDESSPPPATVDPALLSRQRSGPPSEPYAVSSVRSTQAPGSTRRGSRRAPGTLRRAQADIQNPGRQDRRRDLQELINRYRPSIPWRRPVLASSPSGAEPDFTLDEMSEDRNRSLSPEGDNVWDTLLSTVTPDPQPPSAGSSFASASVSATASQSAAVRSPGTSLTTPDTAEQESGPEQPCDSACENSDTEGDEDEDGTERNALIRFSGLRRRSYADVARGNDNEDALELLGGIGGMQHIVRSLARREDIPDEWWAEAGLSRTLPRDDSSS